MTDTPIRQVNVSVSGEPGSGKSTLIALLAQALEGAGHVAIKPPHIKTASAAIADLHHKFEVTFGEEVQQAVDDAASAIGDVTQENAALRAENAALRRELETRPQRMSSSEVNHAVARIITYVRDATMLDQARADINRHIDEKRDEARKLRDEAEARSREAEAMLRHALTGVRPPRATPASIQEARRAAARNLSASDKLALANGADPADVAERGAARLASSYHDRPEIEATLAGDIARLIETREGA